MVRIIGLSGGVCSGKSTCKNYVEELGAKVVDCDKLGHKTYEIGTDCYKKLIEHFGEIIIKKDDKSINRRELGKIVYSSEKEMKKLREIVWPEIEKLILKEIKEFKGDIIVFEAAVLIEAKWYVHMNEVWILNCPVDICLKRLMSRNKMNEETAQKIIKNQTSIEERLKFANVIIDSSLPIDKMKEQIKKAYEKK